MGMFDMGTGRLLDKDGVGGTAKTVLEQAAEDSAAAVLQSLEFYFIRSTLCCGSWWVETIMRVFKDVNFSSDNFSPELEREIDDMIAKAAFNESQKTFQQMSQKESLRGYSPSAT
jgi:hypothetical protein